MKWYFNNFSIYLEDEDVSAMAHQGPCDEDVEYCQGLPYIREQLDKISDEDLRSELREYGAWDSEELENRSDNEMRILWIAAWNSKEDIQE